MHFVVFLLSLHFASLGGTSWHPLSWISLRIYSKARCCGLSQCTFQWPLHGEGWLWMGCCPIVGLCASFLKQKVPESPDPEETVFLTIYGGSLFALYLSNWSQGWAVASQREAFADYMPFYFLSWDSQESEATFFLQPRGVGPGIWTMGCLLGHQARHSHIWLCVGQEIIIYQYIYFQGSG